MSRQSVIHSLLGRLRGLGGILDRPKGVKNILGFGRSGFAVWSKTIELQDVLGGGVVAPSEADSVDEALQCNLTLIRSEEL